jgi:hypothetical protein
MSGKNGNGVPAWLVSQQNLREIQRSPEVIAVRHVDPVKGFRYEIRDAAGMYVDAQGGYDTPHEAFESAAESIRMFAENETEAQSVTVSRVDADGTVTVCETRTGFESISRKR